jgi:hypothetical protein
MDAQIKVRTFITIFQHNTADMLIEV